MSDFDKLKRNYADEDRVEAVYQAKDEEIPVSVKKPNVFSVVLATIKRDKEYLDKVNTARELPSLSHSVLSFFIVLGIALTLAICYFSVSKMILIPLLLVFCPLALPIIIIVFYYEIHRDRSVDFFKFALTFVIGFVFYLLLNFLNKRVLYSISFYSDIENYVYPVIYAIALFSFTFLIANSFKATSLSACFLIAVTLAMSYYFLETLNVVFTKLFIVVKNEELIGKDISPAVSAIVGEESYLEQSITNLFEGWFDLFVYRPYMFSGWAMIIGAVASMSVEVRNKKGKPLRSIYLLIMLVVLFFYMTVTSTTIELFDTILKILSFVGTFYVSTNFLNTELIN